MFDMMNLLGKVKEVQAKLKQVKENLVHLQAEGESGAGLVKATVNGDRKLVKLEISPDIIKIEDKEMMHDLIVAAVNIALANIEIKIKEEFKKNTEGVLPNLPGFDFGNLM